MVTKNMGIYRFLCSYQVLISMVPRDTNPIRTKPHPNHKLHIFHCPSSFPNSWTPQSVVVEGYIQHTKVAGPT